MTPPPSNEAIEAAKRFVAGDSHYNWRLCWNYPTAARILVVALEAKEREVEELRKQQTN